ncbi:hypothetical protein WMY93_015229 [Mugilogobius chulae]|uniref:Immunoglobulin V-set domain-containing protein n=1 Tax=Mugilogobius chulae TaxID=88201 RepID=A0AAW0NQN3_9GOBI
MKLWKVLLLWTWSFTTGQEETASCVPLQTCLLPCRLDKGKADLIEWTHTKMFGTVHVLRDGKDELKNQNKAFRGRSALFPEEALKGNLSLQLSQVTLSDEGTYLCRSISYSPEFILNEKRVHLRLEGDEKDFSRFLQ